jgi:hypothetical protein
MEKKRKRNAINAARVQKTAELTGLGERYIRMVIVGDRENKDVMQIYMFLAEGENELLKEARELVSFN